MTCGPKKSKKNVTLHITVTPFMGIVPVPSRVACVDRSATVLSLSGVAQPPSEKLTFLSP